VAGSLFRPIWAILGQVSRRLGWAYFTKKLHQPYRGGAIHNSDLPMVVCACSMQNVPGDSEMFQMDFRMK
jgi:hypothetical protein